MIRLILTSILLPLISFSQGESNNWFFGQNAGLDFSNGDPVAINGSLVTSEGCASISDSDGNLLFYTDGVTVYDQNHQVMPNGQGLLGNASSSQSGVIIKNPVNEELYYVIAADGFSGNSGGLSYSEVDMTLNNGLGDINQNKNIILTNLTAEKVCVISHENEIDFWILTRLEISNTFLAFLLTENGIELNPVTSVIGDIYSSTIGYLRPSPNGDLVAAAYSNIFGALGTVELYDFDRSSGILSNNQIIYSDPNYGGYGVEFSPNGEILYASLSTTDFTGTAPMNSSLVQFDLMAGGTADIANSMIVIDNNLNLTLGGHHWALQLGPNEKIYIAIGGAASLASIDNPNNLGLNCDFVENSVNLAGNMSTLGLPTFVNSYVLNTVSFSSSNYCFGESTFFNVDNNLADSYSWNFGDSLNNNGFTSNLMNPSHTFSDTGLFTVTLTATFDGNEITSSQTVQIINPIVDLGSDLILCENETLILDASIEGNSSYLWHDGSTFPVFDVDSGGVFSVEVNVDGCLSNDQISIEYKASPTAVLTGGDTLCDFNDVTALITINGTPPFNIIYSNGISSDTINTNSSQITIDVENEGVYYIQRFYDSFGCIGSSSGTASYILTDVKADFDANTYEEYIDNSTITFNNNSSNHTISEWSFGDGNTLNSMQDNFQYQFQEYGKFNVELIVTNDFSCKDTISKHINILTYPLFIPNSFTPGGDPINNTFRPYLQKFKDFEMVIYDRWGDEMFRTNDINDYWDGKKNNKILPIGVYIYHIKVTDFANKKIERTGSVTLISHKKRDPYN